MRTASALIPGFPTIQQFESIIKQEKKANEAGYTDRNTTAAVLKELGIIGVKNNTEGAQLGEIKRLQDMNRAQLNRLVDEKARLLQEKVPGLSREDATTAIKSYLKDQRVDMV
jgi:hypothetical protein